MGEKLKDYQAEIEAINSVQDELSHKSSPEPWENEVPLKS